MIILATGFQANEFLAPIDVQDRFNQEIQEELASTVWEAGCTSWYRTELGKNTNNWPGSTFGYRNRTRYFDAGRYELVQPTD